ncbi:hypothetical protein N7532_009102 [Penicillium argentinense]|uniref:tRNA(adenine(34)) deaminase n=1 Tax=Penicillium argentinense TaxID=1131581 RepID=A0A9W9K2A2_9EURO|nr:uncharacterized protein N7532_009102 [Penicillium argentinense]KAJ5090418.1 hypothetical protein N7532_009102 [Penicillium argentinense]
MEPDANLAFNKEPESNLASTKTDANPVVAMGTDDANSVAATKTDPSLTTGTESETNPADAESEQNPVANMSDDEKHRYFMKEALLMGEKALAAGETPVGCVLVHDDKIIGYGMNATNRTMNGSRHAEFLALNQACRKYRRAILRETDLYVTVEPCIMCASALRQFHIRSVYYGAVNDRFGGCGGILGIHADSSIDAPYPVVGGIFRDEAVALLRRFYEQNNDRAPNPRIKKGRGQQSGGNGENEDGGKDDGDDSMSVLG